MAFWNRGLNEEMREVQPGLESSKRQEVETDISQGLYEARSQEILRWINRLKEKNKTKEGYYAVYDAMAEDSTISGALTIICDDATRNDEIRKRKVWIQAKDPTDPESQEIEEALNEFLDDIKIDDNLWTYAYNVLKYGECLLNTHYKDFMNEEVPKGFEDLNGYIYEVVDKPQDILTLEKWGRIVGYAERRRDPRDDKVATGYIVMPVNNYVQYRIDRQRKRETVNLTYVNENRKDREDPYIVDEFKSVIGTSYLENGRTAYQMIDLIETLLLYYRYGKSDNFRTVQVEVGSAGRAETSKILRTIKRLFTTQDSMNMKEGLYQGDSKPIPKGNNVFIATRQGKGEVKIDNVSQNGDIKDIADLEYWLNKLISALGIPKAYLGLEDTNLSGIGNTSLTKQDTRYCRTVEMVQDALKAGVRDQCNHFLDVTFRDTMNEESSYSWDDKFEVCMPKIQSSESDEKLDEFTARLNLAQVLQQFMYQIDGVDMDPVIRMILDNILNLANVDKRFDGITDNPNVTFGIKKEAGSGGLGGLGNMTDALDPGQEYIPDENSESVEDVNADNTEEEESDE